MDQCLNLNESTGMCTIKITFEELKENNWTGVTDYCRYLISINSAATRIEVYRDEMLCLIVNDIKKAATQEADGCRWRTYRKHRSRSAGEGHGEV